MMIYLLKVNVLLAVFYGFYRLLFARDTFFGWRRAALLMLMAAAVLLPAVDLSSWVASHETTASLSEVYREVMLPTVTVVGDGGRFPWWNLLTLIYIIGVAALAARMAWQLAEIVRLRMSCEQAEGQREFYLINDDTCPFSFFRWIFVNPAAQTEEQLREIMTHETAHVEQWHSVDIILAELLAIVCWPNVFAWLLRQEVRLNLEHLADERVMEAGAERKAYQYHLLGLAYGRNVATISNNFNVLPLKLRIKMMNKQRTHSWLRAKYLLLAPVVGVAVVACNLDRKSVEHGVASEELAEAEKQTAQADSTQEKPVVVPVVVDGTPAQDEKQAEEPTLKGKVYDVVEEMPEFPGGVTELMKFVQANVKYPKQAQEKGLQGRVVVQFVVDENGSVVDPKVVRSVDEQLDAEALRVVRQMPKWKAGRQNGESVRVKYNIPVSFRLQ